MYKQDFALDNRHCLICYKHKQTKPITSMLTTFQQQQGDGSFKKGVVHFKRLERASVLNARLLLL